MKILVTLGFASVLLVGCGSSTPEETGGAAPSGMPTGSLYGYRTYKFDETTKDGDKVTCIYVEGYEQGGLWCKPLDLSPGN